MTLVYWIKIKMRRGLDKSLVQTLVKPLNQSAASDLGAWLFTGLNIFNTLYADVLLTGESHAHMHKPLA